MIRTHPTLRSLIAMCAKRFGDLDLIKHGDHDQSSHGRRGSSGRRGGSGRSGRGGKGGLELGTLDQLINSSPWKGVSKRHTEAVDQYVSNSEPFNDLLRRGRMRPADQYRYGDHAVDTIKAMDEMFNRDDAHLKTDAVVFRGVDLDKLGVRIKDLDGAMIRDKGFTSTSVSLGQAREFVGSLQKRPAILRIRLRKGHRALPPVKAGVKTNAGEGEVILPRGGTYKFSIPPGGATGFRDVMVYDVEYTPKK